MLVELAIFFDFCISVVYVGTEAWANLNWPDNESITKKFALVLKNCSFEN